SRSGAGWYCLLFLLTLIKLTATSVFACGYNSAHILCEFTPNTKVIFILPKHPARDAAKLDDL
ncbi:MAG: hypothetical protein ACKO2P_09375, partial [Planctomycetota bacterium]